MLKLIGVRQDLIEEIARTLLHENKGDNFSRHWIVFPTKRMGVFLRHYLSRTINKPYVPPRIETINDFIASVFDRNFPGFADIDEIRGSFILYQLIRDRFGNDFYTLGKRGTTFLQFYPWALKLFNGIEKILIESRNYRELDRDQFREYIQLGDYFTSYKRFIQELPGLVDEYLNILLSRKMKTRGLIYRKTAEKSETGELKIPEFSNYIFAGFNALNFSESVILKYLHDNLNSLVLLRTDKAALHRQNAPFTLQKDTINLFDDISSYPDKAVKEEWNRFYDKVALYGCVNVETEMHHVYDIIRGIVEKDPNCELEKIGIVLGDPASLIPFLQGVVSRFNQAENKIPFNITLGYPFSRTPLYQLIDLILKVGESRRGKSLYYKDYLALVRHPYIKTSAESHLIKGIHYLEEIITRDNLVYFEVDDLVNTRVKDLMARKGEESHKEEIIREIESMHEYFIVGLPVSFQDLCEFLYRALYYVKDRKGGISYLFLEEYILTAVNCIDDLVDFFREEAQHLLTEEFGVISGFIRYSLSRETINFSGSPLKGIQVMGMLEFRGLKFDQVIVIDTNEGIFPQLLKYDPLMPFDVQRLFSIRTYTDWEQLFAFNFFSVIASAGKAHVLWTEKKGLSGHTEKSRFIQRINFEVEKMNQKVPLVNKTVNLTLEKASLTRVTKNKNIFTRLDQIQFSPSSLETYIRCPLRFYYQRILKLLEKDEVSPEPDAGDFGTVIHEILSDFYNNAEQYLPLDQNKIPEIEKNLSTLVEKRFSKNFDIHSGIIKIRLWVVLRKLAEFIRNDLERMTEKSIQIIGLEKKLSMEYAPEGLDRVLIIEGIIDRIEKEGDLYRIVDYKTGSDFSPGVTDPSIEPLLIHGLDEPDYIEGLQRLAKRYKSLQLLIYIMIYNETFVKDYGRMDASYVFLRKASKLSGIFEKRNTELISTEKIDLMRVFHKDLSSVFMDIFTRAEFIPNPSDERYCSFCPYQVPCGNI